MGGSSNIVVEVDSAASLMQQQAPGMDSCSYFVCPDGYVLKADAGKIRCKGDTCVPSDRDVCCKKPEAPPAKEKEAKKETPPAKEEKKETPPAKEEKKECY